ncbi:hypothetical protein JYT85_02170 [Desulfocapsa sp. AH-315-G09]|nr:hypothetical protein [bacterium AH-315-I07]MBN4065434.1 hypothetical protein [Desulfocapsa sp. AH-315-G09]
MDTISSAMDCADNKNSKTDAPVYNALGTPYKGKLNENAHNGYLKCFGKAIMPIKIAKNATTYNDNRKSTEENTICPRTNRLTAKKKNRSVLSPACFFIGTQIALDSAAKERTQTIDCTIGYVSSS